MRISIPLIAAMFILASPGAALAQGSGDNAGVDEYTETVPEADGDRPSGSGSPANGGQLAPSDIASLETLGPDGQAAARVAQATSPSGSSAGTGSKGGPNGSAGEDSGGSQDPSVIAAVGDAAGGSDSGMGIALPIILAATALGALGLLIARRRRGSTPPT